MFDHKVFFAAIRKSVFGGSMSQPQVDGVQSILDACIRHNVTDPHHVAQILAHVRRETGGYMLPIKETVMPHHKDKNPSDKTVISRLDKAWAAGKLGKVKTPYWRNGGFGRGQIQLTHLTAGGNYDKFGKILKIPLRENPSLALDLKTSADIAVIGMRDGEFTGKKLSQYKFPESLEAKPANHPRRIVNGVDGSDSEISRDHKAFYAALVKAGWGSAPVQSVVVPAKNLYDGNKHQEVLSVQEKLDALGYPEVGAFDGRWGNRTRAAVLAFRADNGLPLDPLIDDALLAALMVAKPREEGKARAEATISDLRKEDVPEIKQTDQTKLGGGAMIGVGTIYGAGEVLDKVDTHSETLTKIAAAIDPLKAFIQDNFWLLLIGGGAFFIWKSGILSRIRLEKHQTGKDVSE